MKTKVIILIAALLAIGKVSAQPYADKSRQSNDLYSKPINRTKIDKQEKIIYEKFKNQVKQILGTYQLYLCQWRMI
jgi:hypothetical protein